MVNYANMLSKLDDLKEILIQTIHSSDNSDELTKKLISMSAKDPVNSDLYQLILLVSSNTETSHNSFKQTAIRVINDIITHKMRLVEVLEDHEGRVKELELHKVQPPKIIKVPMIGEIEVGVIKIKDALMFVVITFMLFFAMESIDSNAVTKAVIDIKSLIWGS